MTDETPQDIIIPLASESVRLGKRVLERGRVRVSLTTETSEETLRDTLRGRRAEVERVPVGREVETAPPLREEGDVIVIPVLEEILVVEKRLVLREEIRIRLLDTEEIVERTVERRTQRAVVERLPPEPDVE